MGRTTVIVLLGVILLIAIESLLGNELTVAGLVDQDSGVAKRPLRFGHINFLHTTDTHGWLSGHLNQPTYNADWGDYVSFAHHMKAQAHDRGLDLILVDSGDRHDGNGLSDITSPNGARSSPIFVHQDYDLITLGNHELYLWENSEQERDVFAAHYKENYVCSNVEYIEDGTWKPFGPKYRYFTTPKQNLRVLAFAFLFDFNRNNDNTKVTPIEKAVDEEWFQNVLDMHPPEDVDLIVVAGHIPMTKQWTELQFLHSALRNRYPNTTLQYFGGHSHIRDFSVFDGKSTGLQSGRFCETLGFLSINMTKDDIDLKDRFFRSYIDFSTDSFKFHTNTSIEEFSTKRGLEVKSMLQAARSDLQLDKVLGHVKLSNYFMDYVPLTHPKNLYRLLTSKVLPTLKPKSQDLDSEERIIIINTGSVRYDMYQGPYTVDSHFIISPFQNDWVKVTLPKKLALKIAPKLNEKSYILGSNIPDEHYLKPPHQWFQKSYDMSARAKEVPMTYPDILGEVDMRQKLRKGYVTYDDFGRDGDDTPHKGTTNYPIPNVVQSEELKSGSNGPIDVVFYSFLIPNIRGAITDLGGEMPEVQFYSDEYLGKLLDKYVSENEV